MLSTRATQLAKTAANRLIQNKQAVRTMGTAKSFVSWWIGHDGFVGNWLANSLSVWIFVA
jgi:hypothetical protein